MQRPDWTVFGLTGTAADQDAPIGCHRDRHRTVEVRGGRFRHCGPHDAEAPEFSVKAAVGKEPRDHEPMRFGIPTDRNDSSGGVDRHRKEFEVGHEHATVAGGAEARVGFTVGKQAFDFTFGQANQASVGRLCEVKNGGMPYGERSVSPAVAPVANDPVEGGENNPPTGLDDKPGHPVALPVNKTFARQAVPAEAGIERPRLDPRSCRRRPERQQDRSDGKAADGLHNTPTCTSLSFHQQ